jgi:hypothetical protein
MKKYLGDLLVDAGIITSLTVQRALERQKQSGGMLGEILAQMGVITDDELVQALARQFGFKRVASLLYPYFYHISLGDGPRRNRPAETGVPHQDR